MRADEYVIFESDAFREESESLDETAITNLHVVTNPRVSVNGTGVSYLAIEVNGELRMPDFCVIPSFNESFWLREHVLETFLEIELCFELQHLISL